MSSCNLRTCLSLLVRLNGLTIVNNALGWVSKLACSEECAQVAIFNVCYEWRICSVWQVVNQMETFERGKLRSRHMSNYSYIIERTMQSSPLSREGGLRNDAARAALWRTRPYECAIDVCQLLTMVIADACREWVFIFTDLQRIADLFNLTSCVMS